jgi:hypothetical protein
VADQSLAELLHAPLKSFTIHARVPIVSNVPSQPEADPPSAELLRASFRSIKLVFVSRFIFLFSDFDVEP